jgi:hypothetical protein
MRSTLLTGAIMLCAGLCSLAAPAWSIQCPSEREMVTILRCMNAADQTATAYGRCAGHWGLAPLWDCLRFDPAYDNIPLSALTPRPAPTMPPPANPLPTNQPLTCGPQLAMELARRIDRENPGAEAGVKYLAVERGLQLMGCLPPR